jgi:hypothetical protein
MRKECLDSKEFDKHSLFLSEITGLSINSSKIFPELDLLGPSYHPSMRVPFSYDLILGNEGNQYKLNLCVMFTDEWTSSEWLPEVSWRILYNNREIYDQGGMVNTSVELFVKDFQNRQKVETLIYDQFHHAIGGPDTEVAFMDYETYSLESLKNENRYFENIYLVLMTHMKERGLVMPPILSKKAYIREPMRDGDIQKVDGIITSVMAYEDQNLPGYVRAHMKYETIEIKKHALWEAKKKNLAVPLQEAFPYVDIKKIEKGNPVLPPYTLLAVENDLRNYGEFSSVVIRSLEKDGRFKGSQVITEVNLSDCMQLCSAGRVDIVLFDWSNPSHEEVLMVRHENPNPFYQMYYGSAQAALSFDDDGIKASTPNGKLLDFKAMKEESEQIDIRNEWMNMIKSSCAQSGIQAPPSFIVRSRAEFQDIAKIVSQKLGKSIS